MFPTEENENVAAQPAENEAPPVIEEVADEPTTASIAEAIAAINTTPEKSAAPAPEKSGGTKIVLELPEREENEGPVCCHEL